MLEEIKISTKEGAGSSGGIVIRKEAARLLVRRKKKRKRKTCPSAGLVSDFAKVSEKGGKNGS